MTKRNLNILIALSASLAIYFGMSQMQLFLTIFKPLTTTLVITLLVLFHNPNNKYFYRIVLIALIFCLFGDVFLLNDDYFIYGLSSFFIGHAFFIYAFCTLGGFKFYWQSLLVLLGINALFLSILIPNLGELLIPVLAYVCCIMVMVWQGINLRIWKSHTSTKLIALAVVLFMISDSVIAINKFILPFDLSTVVILTTYWLSITLIANSTHYIE